MYINAHYPVASYRRARGYVSYIQPPRNANENAREEMPNTHAKQRRGNDIMKMDRGHLRSL